MKKVCHVSSAHNVDDGRIFHKECTSLAAYGFETSLVAIGSSGVENSVRRIGLPGSESRSKRMTSVSRAVIDTALEQDADLYHLHDPELLTHALRLKRAGKVVVFDSHENTVAQIRIKPYLNPILRNLIAGLYGAFETYVAKRIDAVVLPGTTEEGDFFRGRAERTLFVNNYPRLSEFVPKPRKEFSRTVCCIGSLTEARGITKMLEAAQLFDAQLILAGTFETEEYERSLEDRGLLEGVDYRGPVGRAEVVSIYEESALGLSTLRRIGQYETLDNLPTKDYECMAMGLPVVSSDYPFARKMVELYDHGVTTDTEDPKRIAEAVDSLLSSPETLHQKGANGRRAVVEKFNWEHEANALIALYESLLQDRSPR